MDLNSILTSKIQELFPEGKEKKGEWWTLNPLRNDTTPNSFSINLKTGLWKDFADNSSGNMPLLIAKKKGTTVKELWKEYGCSMQTNNKFYHWEFGYPSVIYPYCTIEGKEVGHVLRYDTSKGKEIRPHSNGKMNREGFPNPYPLYNCHKLTPGKKILIVEGEKTCEAAQRLIGGIFNVVTWLGGAASALQSDWSVLSNFNEIYLWPDNDGDGIKAMQTICTKLLAAESTSLKQPIIKIVDISSIAALYNLPQKWDLADCDKTWTQERIIKHLNEAPQFNVTDVNLLLEENKTLNLEAPAQQNISTLFCGLDELGDDWIFEKPKKRLALLRDKSSHLVIPQGKVGLLIAAGGTGKSQFTMQLVASLSTNRSFLDLFLAGESNGKIAYISGEEDLEEIQYRFQSISEQFNFSREERLKLIRNISILPLSTIHCSFSESTDSFQNKLLETLNKRSPENGWSLIIFDPASRFLTKDAEIDNKEATNFICECE